jgi:PhnB protein
MPTPDGKAILHAELQIGNSVIYLNDPCPNSDTQSPVVQNDSPVTIHLQVDDADVWFNRAVNAGATVIMPLEDAFWGDRYGIIRDSFGMHWSIGSHVEDLSPEEVQQRAALMFAS